MISGFSIDNAAYEVTHLRFADDTIIIIFDAYLDQVNCLKNILRWFEMLSGLKINFGKCELISICMEEYNVKNLANVFGCKVGRLPTQYLGLPWCLGLPKKSLWDPVVERFDKNNSILGRRDICLWVVVLPISSQFYHVFPFNLIFYPSSNVLKVWCYV